MPSPPSPPPPRLECGSSGASHWPPPPQPAVPLPSPAHCAKYRRPPLVGLLQGESSADKMDDAQKPDVHRPLGRRLTAEATTVASPPQPPVTAAPGARRLPLPLGGGPATHSEPSLAPAGCRPAFTLAATRRRPELMAWKGIFATDPRQKPIRQPPPNPAVFSPGPCIFVVRPPASSLLRKKEPPPLRRTPEPLSAAGLKLCPVGRSSSRLHSLARLYASATCRAVDKIAWRRARREPVSPSGCGLRKGESGSGACCGPADVASDNAQTPHAGRRGKFPRPWARERGPGEKAQGRRGGATEAASTTW